MPRTKKFAWKRKLRENKCAVVNMMTRVSERRMPHSDKVAKTILQTITSIPPTKIYMSLVNTELNEGGNNFCNGNFTENWHVIVYLNPLCVFIIKCTNCEHCSGDTSLFEKPSSRRCFANSGIKRCECDNTVDITSNITKCRLRDKNIPVVYGVSSTLNNRDASKVLRAMLNIP
jgi:hypothetical protein